MPELHNYKNFMSGTTYDPAKSVATATLKTHQVAMCEYVFREGGGYTLLYAAPSAGKTFVALSCCEQVSGLRIIVSPAHPIPNYQIDFDKFYTNQKPFTLLLPTGTIRAKWAQIAKAKRDNMVVVLSYEAACKMPLEKLNASLVICDEGHRLGAYNSKQSISLARRFANVPLKVAMTGTAYHDASERLFGIYRFFDPVLPKQGYPYPKLFGKYDDFLDNFFTTYMKGYTRIIKGRKNEEQMAALIRPAYLEIKSDDIGELPETTIKVYRAPMLKETRDAYDKLNEDAIIRFDDDAVFAPHILTRMLRLQQLSASGELETEDGETVTFDITPRLNVLREIMAELETEPTVIFSRFKRDVNLINKVIGGKALKLTGGTDQHEAWKRGEAKDLIANVASGSEGVRLDRAHHTIIWSLGYSLKQWVQILGRTRRTTQHSKFVVYHIILTEGTIDEAIYEALQDKMVDVETLEQLLRG